MKKLKIAKRMIGASQEGAILCPTCGSEYTHQGKVEIFNREEDAGSGLHVTISGDATTTDGDLLWNPSPRRHGLTINFDCEGCDEIFAVDIYQHKGSTMIRARSAPPA